MLRVVIIIHTLLIVRSKPVNFKNFWIGHYLNTIFFLFCATCFNLSYPDKTLVIVVIIHKKAKRKPKKGKRPGNIQIITKKIMVSVPSVSPPI